MKKLYKQVLQIILHSIGSDISNVERENAIEFARNAFKIDQETHDAIYKDVIKIIVTNACLYYIF